MSGKITGPRVNLVGQKFGRLTVTALHTERSSSGKVLWVCRCDCGDEVCVIGASLVNGLSKSCGCLQRDTVQGLNLKHGRSNTRVDVDPIYRTWLAMRNRCNNPRSKDYKTYGGRGISVCAEWDDFEKFATHMGPKPTPDHSIDRKDSNGNYEPGNVRWATDAEQHANRRQHAMQQPCVVCGMEFDSLRSAARKLGMCRRTVRKLAEEQI